MNRLGGMKKLTDDAIRREAFRNLAGAFGEVLDVLSDQAAKRIVELGTRPLKQALIDAIGKENLKKVPR